MEVLGSRYLEYWHGRGDRLCMLPPAGALVGQFLQAMVGFPPRQSPASWSPEQMPAKLRENEQAIKAAAHPG